MKTDLFNIYIAGNFRVKHTFLTLVEIFDALWWLDSLVSLSSRYLGMDEQTLRFEFEGLTMRRQLTGICIPASSQHMVSSQQQSASSAQRYRQVRHNINTASPQNLSVMPGVRPSFRYVMCLYIYCPTRTIR